MMLSGYFSYNISRDKVKYRLKQMLLLTAASLLFYTIVHFVNLLLTRELTEKMASIDLSDFADFFLFNSPRDLIGSASTPTWYLLAISYIYTLYLIFYKHFHRLTSLVCHCSYWFWPFVSSSIQIANFTIATSCLWASLFHSRDAVCQASGSDFSLRLVVCQEMGD